MKRINNKGFTIAEVIVSFTLITIIMVSVISATIYYRDKLKREEVISKLADYKNTITKVVYDDIVDETKGIYRIERCIGLQNCVNFVGTDDKSFTLRIVEVPETTTDNIRGVYLAYGDSTHNTMYMLPDSDLGDGNDRVCDFIGGFETYESGDGLYKLKVTFQHKDIDYQKSLVFVIS